MAATHVTSSTAQSKQISAEAKTRFAKEVAKFPANQKQSAVMACLPCSKANVWVLALIRL